MRLLRRRAGPRAQTARPAAEPYLAAGAELARQLGHNYVGTEHVLSVLIRDPEGAAPQLLDQFGVGADAVEAALARWLADGTAPARIDPQRSRSWGSTSRRCANGSSRHSGRARSSAPAPAASASAHD